MFGPCWWMTPLSIKRTFDNDRLLFVLIEGVEALSGKYCSSRTKGQQHGWRGSGDFQWSLLQHFFYLSHPTRLLLRVQAIVGHNSGPLVIFHLNFQSRGANIHFNQNKCADFPFARNAPLPKGGIGMVILTITSHYFNDFRKCIFPPISYPFAA